MKKALLVFAGIYLSILLVLYLGQDWVIFRADPLPEHYTFEFEQQFVEKTYVNNEGVPISTLFFPADGPSKGLVFNNHGNRRNISRWGRTAEEFTKRGYDVFFYDYRGFGKTPGTPSEKNIFNDSEFLYQQMKKRYPEEKIVMYGRSLGTGVATRLASKFRPKMLILETPYFHMAHVGKLHIPIFPYDFLIKHPFRSDLFIQEVECPVYLIHGTDDELVPYESSELLLRNAQKAATKDLLTINGGHHRGLSRFEAYQSKLDQLLAE